MMKRGGAENKEEKTRRRQEEKNLQHGSLKCIQDFLEIAKGHELFPQVFSSLYIGAASTQRKKRRTKRGKEEEDEAEAGSLHSLGPRGENDTTRCFGADGQRLVPVRFRSLSSLD